MALEDETRLKISLHGYKIKLLFLNPMVKSEDYYSYKVFFGGKKKETKKNQYFPVTCLITNPSP